MMTFVGMGMTTGSIITLTGQFPIISRPVLGYPSNPSPLFLPQLGLLTALFLRRLRPRAMTSFFRQIWFPLYSGPSLQGILPVSLLQILGPRTTCSRIDPPSSPISRSAIFAFGWETTRMLQFLAEAQPSSH